MQNGCVRTKKDRVRLRVSRRTAASKHGRSYAITLHPTTNIWAMQGLPPGWLLWFIRFVWLNQIHKTNQTNQSNQFPRYCRCSRP
ncbi:MAG: hypothetical protein JW395_2025 [Nitrospira sp.]|nr:hypothetical protein [Nitrospira sp.]